MESVYLKTLIEVARTGSFTKAAEELFVTQSAVSRRIKFLEEIYARPLLDRSGPVLIPTKEGRLVLEKAKKILSLEGELLLALDSLDQNLGLSLVCTGTFGIVHLPEILKDFMTKSNATGNLKFIFATLEKILQGLKDGRFDVAVIEHCQHFDLADYEMVALPGDEMIFVASPTREIGGEVENFETLFAEALYTRDEYCCSREMLERNLQSLGHTTSEFRQIVVYNDLNVILQSLLRGEGIAFISSDFVAPYLRAGTLVSFKVAGFIHQRYRTLLFNSTLPKGSPVTEFVESVYAHFPHIDKNTRPVDCCSKCTTPGGQ